MWQDRVGARSAPVRNWVERGAVRKFADAIGDPNPLYRDDDAAARSWWGRLIAPPTFPRTFDYGVIPDVVLPSAGLIHGEQTYTYRRPLFVGEEVLCHSELTHVVTKQGRSGELTFLTFRRTGVDTDGEWIFRADEVVVVTETVMRSVAS